MPETIDGLKLEIERLKIELETVISTRVEDAVAATGIKNRSVFLEAMLETMPIGVIMAEAPSGKIIMGNRRAEELVRHPILESADVDSYGEWVSFHANGQRVETHEYPLSRVIRDGEEYSELDVNYQRGDGTKFWVRIVGRPVRDQSGTMIGAAIALFDIDNERHLMAQQEVLIDELNHRVKNAFTVVKSIVSQSLRVSNAPPDMRITIDSRLDAYAKAHSQLIGSRWDQASIKDIADDTIGQIAEARITMDGPSINVPSRVAMALSMAFYELATNAIKHGSLSDPNGTVRLWWDQTSDEQPALFIEWVELGGPAPVEPTTKGFGSKIIDQILAAETYGKVIIDYPDTGLTWSLQMPMTEED